MIGTFQWWEDPGYSVCSAPTIPCSMKFLGLPLLVILGSPLIVTGESLMMPWISYTKYQDVAKVEHILKSHNQIPLKVVKYPLMKNIKKYIFFK